MLGNYPGKSTLLEWTSHIEAHAFLVANKAIGAGAVITVGGGATGSLTGVWAGIAIGLAGLLVNSIAQFRKDRRSAAAERRAQEMHEAQLRALWRNAAPPGPDRIEADE